MTLDEIKELNVTVTKITTYSLKDERSEGYLDIFLNEYIPNTYGVDWEEMSDKEILKALEDFNYENADVLEETFDYYVPEETEDIKIWKEG